MYSRKHVVLIRGFHLPLGNLHLDNLLHLHAYTYMLKNHLQIDCSPNSAAVTIYSYCARTNAQPAHSRNNVSCPHPEPTINF